MVTDNVITNISRVGKVSSVNPDNMTARVTFADKNNMLSAELPIINRGSKNNKDYWLPDVGEQVVCLFLSNGINQGFVLGSYFSDPAPPQISSVNKRRLDFADGTYIEYDRDSHKLNIHCVGDIRIKGANIFLN